MKKSIGKIILSYGLVIVAVFIFYLIFCGIVGGKKFYPNTTINGIDVSKMTVSEAASAVGEDFQSKYNNVSVAVVLDDDTYHIDISDAFNLDVTDAVQHSLENSHKFMGRGINYIKSLFTGLEYTASPALENSQAISTSIDNSGISDMEGVEESAYQMGEKEITVVKGKGGYIVDTDQLVLDIEALFANGDLSDVIDCPLTYTDVDLDVIYNEIYTEPEDATLDPDNGYAIVDSVDGISFDLEGAKALLAAAADGETVTIPLVFTEAEITTSELEDSLFRDVLGSFQTNVGGSAARKSNVQLAAEKCDEYIMLPGDIFGFNETVGERTAANGFSAAPAYVNGDTVDEIGGGICQVSSTIYNACLLANLEITERSNHSYTSSYVDVGFDATVSWGGPDYKFCNDTDYPIKLVMVYENSTLTAKIYGTKVDDITVKMSSEILSVDNYETKYEDDDTMEAGKQTTSVVGETGYKVQTYRSLYDGNGNLISTTEESYSNYKRRDKVVLVGTKGSTTTEASTDTEETEEATTEAATEATTEAPATTEAATTEAPAAETPTE